MRTHRLLSLLALVFLLRAPAWGEEALPYRLVGLVGTADGRLAVVEFPGPQYEIFRLGDSLGGGVILEIADRWVRVGKGGEETLLHLGSGEHALAPADAVRSGTNLTWQPDAAGLIAALDRAEGLLKDPLVRAPDSVKSTDATPPADGSTRGIDDAVLNGILNLPPGARVSEIDGKPIRTAQQGMHLLREALSGGGGVIISVSGVPGTETLYLHPSPIPRPGSGWQWGRAD